MTRIKIEGLRDLDQALGQFKVSTGKNVLRRVGRAALEPFDADWRAQAPVSVAAGYHMRDTGDVGSKLSKRQRRMHRRESEVEIHAGPGPDPAAVQQEFGNENHPAQPFVRPAWEANKDGVLDAVRSGLGEEIARTAARVAKRTKRR